MFLLWIAHHANVIISTDDAFLPNVGADFDVDQSG